MNNFPSMVYNHFSSLKEESNFLKDTIFSENKSLCYALFLLIGTIALGITTGLYLLRKRRWSKINRDEVLRQKIHQISVRQNALRSSAPLTPNQLRSTLYLPCKRADEIENRLISAEILNLTDYPDDLLVKIHTLKNQYPETIFYRHHKISSRMDSNLPQMIENIYPNNRIVCFIPFNEKTSSGGSDQTKEWMEKEAAQTQNVFMIIFPIKETEIYDMSGMSDSGPVKEITIDKDKLQKFDAIFTRIHSNQNSERCFIIV